MNPETQIAEAKQAAERDAFRQTLTSDAERAAFDSMLSAVAAPAAPADLPANAPLPGYGAASGVSAAPAANMAPPPARYVHGEYAGDKWDVDLRVQVFPGVAEKEIAAARAALEAYEDFRFDGDNDALLRDDWQSAVSEREARQLQRFVDAGEEIPADHVSLVEKALRDRPLVVAKARNLMRAVQRADAAAVEAVTREAPKALPRVQAELHAALDEVDAAISALDAAASKVRALHAIYVPLAVKVRKPLPTVQQSWHLTLLDLQSARHELTEALRSARGRVGRPAAAE